MWGKVSCLMSAVPLIINQSVLHTCSGAIDLSRELCLSTMQYRGCMMSQTQWLSVRYFSENLYLVRLFFHNIHWSALPKNCPSSLPTSRLNVSTSCQQSSGLRSLILKQLTNSFFAASTALSFTTSSLNCLFSNLSFSASISFCTLTRLKSLVLLSSKRKAWSAAPGTLVPSALSVAAVEILLSISFKDSSVCALRRCSCSLTRAWMWDSRSLARVPLL